MKKTAVATGIALGALLALGALWRREPPEPRTQLCSHRSVEDLVRSMLPPGCGTCTAGCLESIRLRMWEAEASVHLANALVNGSEVERRRAALFLGYLGPAARPAVSALVESLRNREATLRAAAAEALGNIGDAAAAPPLGSILATDDAVLRAHAAIALWKITRDAAASLPVLTRALKENDGNLREAIVEALGQMTSAAGTAVPDLIELTRGRHCTGAAIVALGRIGPAAAPAASRLRELTRDSDALVRVLAAEALGETQLLRASLDDSDARVRVHAAFAWWKRTRQAEPAVHVLARAIDAREARPIRLQAIEALREIATQSAVDALVRALDAGDALVRVAAVQALGAMRASRRDVIDALTNATRDEIPLVAHTAREALRPEP